VERGGSALGLAVVDVLWIDVTNASDADSEGSGESVDEKVTELVFVNDTVCLLWLFGHTSASGLLQLTSFERYSFAVRLRYQYRTL
jgi:hypothetical protein